MMRGSNKWRALAVVAGLAVSLEAGAEEVTKPSEVSREPGSAGAFGQAGQFVMSTDASGFFGYNTGSEDLTIRLEPAADYFLQSNLSLGAAGLIQQTFREGPNVTAVGVLFRVGYAIPVGEKLTLWPKLSFGPKFAHSSAGDGQSDLAFVLDATAPVLFHVAPHFFLGAGPQVRAFISDDGAGAAGGSDLGSFYGSDVTIGVTTVVGGYF